MSVLETISVLITNLTRAQNYTPGSNILINSAVSVQAARTVTKVEFYANSTKIGENLTAPYSITWTNAPAGSYAITAKAIDNTGAVWSSPLYLISSTNATAPNAARGNTASLPLNLSPNPAHSQVVLSTNAPQDGDYALSILDLTGKVVVLKNLNLFKGENTESLDISKLPKGMYLVRMAQIGGTDYAIQKLVIE